VNRNNIKPIFVKFWGICQMPLSTAGDRVRFLLEKLWNGHQTKMARDTNCAQPTLSLVASGKNEPGKRLLALIAAHPEVNEEWLFHGTGEPINPLTKLAGNLEYFLPVVNRALNVSQSEDIRRLANEKQEVLKSFYNKTSYFIRVQHDEPITNDVEMAINKGDLLLIDRSPDSFPEKHRLFRTLCVVREPKNAKRVCLGLVTYLEAEFEEGPERIEVDTFDIGLRKNQIIRESRIVDYRGKKRRTEKQFKLVGDPEHQRKVPVSQSELEPSLPQISYEDIIGVFKLMLRKTF